MSKGRRNRQAAAREPIEVLHFKTDPDDTGEEEEYVPLFTIDDKSYDLWINPPASVGLEYLKRAADYGVEAAAVWILEEMIGEDGYAALQNYKKLEVKQLEKILAICKRHAMGDEQGNG